MQIQVEMSEIFAEWLAQIKDLRAKAKIQVRIKRLMFGNFGDVKNLGQGLLELRMTEGKGYRVYFTHINNRLVFLLCGGDKSTQSKDIEKARAMLREIGE